MLKKAYRFWPVVVAVILMGTVSSCCWLGLFCPRPQQVFTVEVRFVDGTLQFSPDPVRVHTLDFVQWSNPFDGPMTIALDDGLAMPYLQIVSPGDTGTVMIRAGATLTVHKYAVTAVVGGETITVDPYIEVEEEGDGDRSGEH